MRDNKKSSTFKHVAVVAGLACFMLLPIFWFFSTGNPFLAGLFQSKSDDTFVFRDRSGNEILSMQHPGYLTSKNYHMSPGMLGEGSVERPGCWDTGDVMRLTLMPKDFFFGEKGYALSFQVKKLIDNPDLKFLGSLSYATYPSPKFIQQIDGHDFYHIPTPLGPEYKQPRNAGDWYYVGNQSVLELTIIVGQCAAEKVDEATVQRMLNSIKLNDSKL